MRQSMMFRVPMLLVAVSTLGQAQVSSSIRRLSKDFSGEVPLVWTIEGFGRLRQASMRLLNDAGMECIPLKPMATTAGAGGTWVAWSMVSPAGLFRNLEAGRYTAEWTLEWDVDGKARQERTEAAFRVEEKGDGWLQQAFTDADPSPAQWIVPSQWIPGATLPIELKSAKTLRTVRYQIVDDRDEQVRRPWVELKQDKAGKWSLPSDASWAPGILHLWFLVEDGQGGAWVQAREVLLGAAGALPTSQSPRVQIASKGLAAAAIGSQQTLAGAQGPLLFDPTTDWLNDLNESDPPPWNETNRVATVTVGYVDEERNGTQLWPTDEDRPMSLGVSGADRLGNPIYSVSYLLAARASSATALEDIASQGASVGSSVFPPGANEVPIGKVAAPVVFSAGKVEDLLGKPLVAGYGWAASTNGTPIDAATWTQQPLANSVPPVGLNAIKDAKAMKAQLIQKDLSAAGYSGGEEILLDDTRDGYALTVASQDPLGRTILSKGIGALHRDGIVAVLNEPPATYTCSFDAGQPSWLFNNGSARLDSAAANPNANPNFVLEPARRASTTYGGTAKFRNRNDPAGDSIMPERTVEENLTAGEAWINLGRLLAGTTITVQFTSTGAPVVVDWVLDGGSTILTTSNTSPLSQPGLTTATQVALRFKNGRAALAQGATITESDRVRLDNLDIRVTPPPAGVEPVPAVLQQPVVPGFSRTQYGMADLPDGSRYTVTMVTDPDGSAVAELKDLEGRTAFKIVNPTTTYTNYFKDYQGNTFQPSQPVTRGLNGGVGAGTDQKDLVTQYVFDTKGHLRAVIPPKGFTALAAPWGVNLTDAQLDGVLSKTSAVVTSPAAYVTYNAYDDSGHLVATYNPDEGLTRFKVDQKGRVHFSQTASQLARPGGATWTRTLYDQIFRVRAVGEVTDATVTTAVDTGQIEAPAIVTNGTQSDFSAAPFSLINRVSVNRYDDYMGTYPQTATTIDAAVRAQLPPFILWGAFADGHLTRTEDAETIERYYYDQDGRIVIRRVTLKDSSGNTGDYAIGIFYDFAGRVKRLVYPAGPTGEPLQVVYTYDDLGRLFAVGTPVDPSYFARYAYHPTGELRAIVYGPGEGFAAKRMLQDPQGWLRSLTVQGR